jgi:manganese-dependent inorganic pyrophosphatase
MIKTTETAADLQTSQAPVYVIGHRNPDTDSVVSAIGYAWLLRERDKLNAQPALAGLLIPQTTFALNAFGIEAPQVLTDASPRFSHVARPVRPLTPDRPLEEAWALIAENGRVAPVVDAEGKPAGLLTAASVFLFLSRRMPGGASGQPEAGGGIPFTQVLSTPCGEALAADVPSFEASTRIKDVLGRVLRSERDNFLIVDKAGRYIGICWKSDLYRPPRLKLILIDHNELSQAVNGVEEAELLEVLDHHRLANLPTHMAIAFHVDPVGSSSTLVTERIMRSGLSVPRPVAGALLSGLLSDTLLLKSPTTTNRDLVAAVQLAAWSFPGQSDSYKAMMDYGWELLRAGAGLESRSVESIVSGDYKEYEAAEIRFGLAQVEVADMREIEPRLTELRAALAAMERERRLDFAALMVTDILETRSRLVTSGATAHLDGLPYSRLDDGTFDLPGVVSRKKQLVPVILNTLQA